MAAHTGRTLLVVVLGVILAAVVGCQSNQPSLGRTLQKLHMTVDDLDLMMKSEGVVLTKVKDTDAVFQNRYYRVGGKVVVVRVGYRPCTQDHLEYFGHDRVVSSWEIVEERSLESCDSAKPEDLDKITINEVTDVPVPMPADGAK